MTLFQTSTKKWLRSKKKVGVKSSKGGGKHPLLPSHNIAFHFFWGE